MGNDWRGTPRPKKVKPGKVAKRKPDHGADGCPLSVLILLGGAGTIVWGVSELVGMIVS